jgi:hypothetical protein
MIFRKVVRVFRVIRVNNFPPAPEARHIFRKISAKQFQAPSGATSSEHAAPTELLHNWKRNLQRYRACGAEDGKTIFEN